jgi:hypothetical protein
MFALRPKQKAIQSLVLPHRADAVETARKHFVDVTLVADIEDKLVLGGLENAVQGDRQLDNAEIWSEVAAGLRQDLYQLLAHFLRKLRQVLLAQRLYVRRRTDAIEQSGGAGWLRRV